LQQLVQQQHQQVLQTRDQLQKGLDLDVGKHNSDMSTSKSAGYSSALRGRASLQAPRECPLSQTAEVEDLPPPVVPAQPPVDVSTAEAARRARVRGAAEQAPARTRQGRQKEGLNCAIHQCVMLGGMPQIANEQGKRKRYVKKSGCEHNQQNTTRVLQQKRSTCETHRTKLHVFPCSHGLPPHEPYFLP
jgi:hypothetical protein